MRDVGAPSPTKSCRVPPHLPERGGELSGGSSDCLSRGFPKGLPFGLVLLHTFLSNKEKYGAAGMTK